MATVEIILFILSLYSILATVATGHIAHMATVHIKTGAELFAFNFEIAHGSDPMRGFHTFSSGQSGDILRWYIRPGHFLVMVTDKNATPIFVIVV